MQFISSSREKIKREANTCVRKSQQFGRFKIFFCVLISFKNQTQPKTKTTVRDRERERDQNFTELHELKDELLLLIVGGIM